MLLYAPSLPDDNDRGYERLDVELLREFGETTTAQLGTGLNSVVAARFVVAPKSVEATD